MSFCSGSRGHVSVRRLGIALVGQSPQPDYEDMVCRWVDGVSVIQQGALDDVSEREIAASARGNDFRLVVRLRTGRPVEVGHALVARNLPGVIRDLAAGGCQVILVACTGDFDAHALASATGGLRAVVLLPGDILLSLASAIWRGRRLAVCTPLSEQREWADNRWRRQGISPVIVHQPICVDRESLVAGVVRALAGLPAGGIDGIVMDCMGYKDEEVNALREATGLPVLNARGAVGATLKTLL